MINYFSKYDPATLERLHQVQLEILKDADALCRKHGLNYFVSGGTAIGAIRHQGFIPWDDDIDICFPRADYEKFMQFAEQEMADKYDLLTPLNTAGYTLMFGRMSKKGTVFVADTDKQCTYKPGIFIDLFPYDKVPIDKKLRRKQIRKAWIWARLIVLRCYGIRPYPTRLQAGRERWRASAASSFMQALLYAVFRKNGSISDTAAMRRNTIRRIQGYIRTWRIYILNGCSCMRRNCIIHLIFRLRGCQ